MAETVFSPADEIIIGTLAQGGDAAERLARQLAGERRILELVATGQPMRESLVEITRLIETISPDAIASVLLVDHEGCLRLGAAPGLPVAYNESIEGIKIGPAVGSCGTAAYTGETVITEDIQRDERWPDFAREVAEQAGVRACWSVPFRGEDECVIGTFATYFRECRRPTEHEIREVQAAAHLARIVVDRERSAHELVASERRFRDVVEHAADAFFMHDVNGNIVDTNQRACDMLGYTRDEILGMTVCDIETALKPGVCRKLWTPLIASAERSASFEGEHRRKDGTTFPVEGRLSVIDTHGETFLCGFVRDISERKQAEHSQRLLMRELDHRAQNDLASVLSIAQQMLGHADSLEEFGSSFCGRIQAMAGAHELLARQHWDGATVDVLVHRMFKPYESRGETTIEIDGREVAVDARTVQPLCMSLHELITNAAKHGALAGNGGSIRVAWDVNEAEKLLTVEWNESSRNAGERAYAAEGFGTRLIREMIPHQVQGEVDLVIDATGVHCTMTMPLRDPIGLE